MKYSSGTCGRVFYLHIEHGEDPIQVITSFVRDQDVRSGVIHFIGAMKNGMVVSGPMEDLLPPELCLIPMPNAHDVIGTAFIRSGTEGPLIHYHISAGRGEETLTGCLRGGAEVFINIEAVIIEFSGFEIPVAYHGPSEMMLPDPKPR